jgi:hypothetical protein
MEVEICGPRGGGDLQCAQEGWELAKLASAQEGLRLPFPLARHHNESSKTDDASPKLMHHLRLPTC